MFWIFKAGLMVTCILVYLGYTASAAPLDSEKTGEEEVKDAVRKAEAAASLAAENSMEHGHKAEARVAQEKMNNLVSHIEDDSSMKEGHVAKKVNVLMKHLSKKHGDSDDENESDEMKRVKEHRVHSKPSLSHLMGMSELGDVSSNTNSYKEDTKLEDRLAIEAEEEKKYEDGYGGQQWDDGPTGGSKGGSWSTNIQRQDAAEKQSIQAQVASESAHELNEIQQAVAAESQSSRGSASMGDQGATVVQVGGNGNVNAGESSRFREQGQRSMEGGASFEAPRVKSYESASHQPSDLSSIITQASKLSPNEMAGPPKQFSSQGMGSMNGFGMEATRGQSISQPESLGSQEVPSSMMSTAFTGAEGTQMGASSFQESESSQRDGFTGGGGLQGTATMEGGNIQPIDIGGNSMGTLAAGFNGAQQQQQFIGGDQGGANVMGALPSMQAAGTGSLGGLPSFGNMEGIQSFGGAGGMGYKKRSKTAKAEKEAQPKEEQRNEKERNTKKSKLTAHHHHRHHHHKRHF